MGRMNQKAAIITGGASGIGEATVRLFLKEGCRVVIADVQDDKKEQLMEELGERATYLHTDVTEEADVKAAIDYAMREFGHLDCLFNNAGCSGVSGPIEETPTEGYSDTMDVLLRGVFFGMKHAARVMKPQGFGNIISNSAIGGIVTGFGSHIYSAAKAAVIHLTRSVAMELGESGIRVNCVCPGGILTPIFGKGQGLSKKAAEQALENMRPILADFQPIRRPGLPEDIANAVLWLATDDSSFVTGHALVVDGGRCCGRTWPETLKQREVLKSAFHR